MLQRCIILLDVLWYKLIKLCQVLLTIFRFGFFFSIKRPQNELLMAKTIRASIFFWWRSLIEVLIFYTIWIIWRIIKIFWLNFRFFSLRFFWQIFWKLLIVRFQIFSERININLFVLRFPIIQILLLFSLWSVMCFLFILSFFSLRIRYYMLVV